MKNTTDVDMSKTIDVLNSFLRGEMSAVETYRKAADKLKTAPFANILRDNLMSHEERVKQLESEIKKLGGEPAKTSGIWGGFAKLVEGSAAAFGDKSAIAALEEGEDHGRNDYQRDIDSVSTAERTFVQKLLDQQLKTHETLSNLKHSQSGESAKYSRH